MTRLKYVLLSGALVVSLGFVGAACTDDDDAESNSNASQQSVDDLNQRLQRDEMLYSVLHLGTLGIHDIDVRLNEEGTIDPSDSRNTRTAARILALTDWGEFGDEAEATRGHAVELLAALHDEDVEAAAAAATDFHDTWHDLETAVWAEIAGELPPEEGGPESHGDEGGDSDTPAEGDHGDDKGDDMEESQ